jgi:hypothetical protein
MLTVVDGGDEALRAGTIDCPDCDGSLRPWGYARLRLVRNGGEGLWVRPRRARCGSCGRTQVLLPCRLLERRRDAVADVGAILEAYAARTGYRRAARELGVPVPTARNWVRQLRGRWPSLAMRFGAGAAPGRPPDDPAAAIRVVRRAASEAGWRSAVWEFASLLTNGSLLTNTS